MRAKNQRSEKGLPADMVDAPNRLLTTTQAAGYLGVTRMTMGNWGRCGRIPVVYLGNRRPRFMLSDLDATLLKNRFDQRMWDPSDKVFPESAVCRLLDMSPQGVWTLKQRGFLPDFSEKSIRSAIKRQYRHEMATEFRAKYEKKIQQQFATMSHQLKALKRLRVQMIANACIHCGKPNYRVSHPDSKWAGYP